MLRWRFRRNNVRMLGVLLRLRRRPVLRRVPMLQGRVRVSDGEASAVIKVGRMAVRVVRMMRVVWVMVMGNMVRDNVAVEHGDHDARRLLLLQPGECSLRCRLAVAQGSEQQLSDSKDVNPTATVRVPAAYLALSRWLPEMTAHGTSRLMPSVPEQQHMSLARLRRPSERPRKDGARRSTRPVARRNDDW